MVLTGSARLQVVFAGCVVHLYESERVQTDDGQWRITLLQRGDVYGKRRHLRGVGIGSVAEAALAAALANVGVIP